MSEGDCGVTERATNGHDVTENHGVGGSIPPLGTMPAHDVWSDNHLALICVPPAPFATLKWDTFVRLLISA